MKDIEIEQLYKDYLEHLNSNESTRINILESIKHKNLKLIKTSYELIIQVLKKKIDHEKGILVSFICLGVEGFNQDPRDSISILALLNRLANQYELDLDSLIEKHINLFDKRVQEIFYNWLKREDKSIENFGFNDVLDNDGNLVGFNLNGIIFNH